MDEEQTISVLYEPEASQFTKMDSKECIGYFVLF